MIVAILRVRYNLITRQNCCKYLQVKNIPKNVTVYMYKGDNEEPDML